MAVNGYSFDEVSLPNPPTYVEGQPIDYLTVKLPTFFKSQYIALLDFISAVQSGFLINSDQVISLDADKITNNTQFTQSLFVGAESKIKLDGANNQITITDSQGTPVTRVILGKLSGATNDYGLRVVDASGVIKFQTGSTTFIDGGIVSANTISATQIAADTITVDQMAANSVTAAEINVSNLSSVNADLGSCTAGTLTGGTIQTAASGARVNLTTDGINGYNASGVHVVDIANDGQFRFGPSGGSNLTWDNSTLTLTGNLITTGNIVEGEVCGRSIATYTDFNIPLNTTDLAEAYSWDGSSSSEIPVAAITLETVGRDAMIAFTPTFFVTDDDGSAARTKDLQAFNVILRIRRGSSTGTLIGTQYIRAGGLESFTTNYNTGGSMTVFDANSNGSLASPADTIYVCTAHVEKFKTGGAGAGVFNKAVKATGSAAAVELRA
jgi:Tfp pilus assembly major pilin PilA